MAMLSLSPSSPVGAGDVKFQYTDENGVIYEKTFTSLANLYSTLNTNEVVILEKQ